MPNAADSQHRDVLSDRPSGPWVIEAQQPVVDEARLRQGLLDVKNRDLIAVGEPARSSRLRGRSRGRRRFVVVDEAVEQIYGERIRRCFDARNVKARIPTLDVSSSQIGGGALLDVAGFGGQPVPAQHAIHSGADDADGIVDVSPAIPLGRFETLSITGWSAADRAAR
jgi:hypothetical protein